MTRILGICDREWPRLLAMSALFLLLMAGWALGRAGRDAFFIKVSGPDKLPYMYMLNAVLIVAVSSLYSRLVDRIARYRFLNLQLLSFGALLLILRALIPLGSAWIPYAIFSLSEVFTLLFLMYYWTFANDVFDPREGKRIFPLVGGAGLIGTIVGGALTQPLVNLLGTVNLFVLWAVLLGLAVPVTLWANRTALAAGISTVGETAGESESLRDTLAYVWEIPLLRTLTYLSVPMWLVVYIVDYQFFLILDEVFGQQDHLTGFLGVFNSFTSLVGLIIQLFVTGWLLRRFGVGITVLAHPASMSLGSIGLAMRSLLPIFQVPGLFSFRSFSGAFAKFSDNAIFYSIGESASQLLYNALPQSRRGRARAFISGTVESACTALAGGILLFFAAFQTPLSVISFLAVALSLLWTLFTLRLKSDYLRALVDNLKAHDPDLSGSAMLALGQAMPPMRRPSFWKRCRRKAKKRPFLPWKCSKAQTITKPWASWPRPCPG